MDKTDLDATGPSEAQPLPIGPVQSGEASGAASSGRKMMSQDYKPDAEWDDAMYDEHSAWEQLAEFQKETPLSDAEMTW